MLGKYIRTATILVLFASGCTAAQEGTNCGTAAVSLQKGEGIAAQALVASGLDLSRYQRDEFGDSAADPQKWLFVWRRKDSLSVTSLVAVDRCTGEAEIHPGM